MEHSYTDEKNVQILIALLKAHNIKKIIASPGTKNMAFVGSVQQDSFFEIYSCVDERSAAYMACGLAYESEQPVILSCTGATASRNYLPGLTEAFYRKLPILAITSTQDISKIGHHIAQVIDRSSPPTDSVRLTVTLPIVKDENDFWDCEIKINKALLELNHRGGGPVHINLPTEYSKVYNIKTLPSVRVIRRITDTQDFPELPKGRIAIFVGSHAPMSQKLTAEIDSFCKSHNAVVFCDHTSGYNGKYRILYDLVACQDQVMGRNRADVLIHIGEISGAYSQFIKTEQVWRISEDGEIRDYLKKLRYIFEIPESIFFIRYATDNTEVAHEYFDFCKSTLTSLYEKIPDLPFSNIWIASKISPLLPPDSCAYLSIYNTLRAWNFFTVPDSVSTFSNVGGFGIDGGVSSLIGASLVNKNKIYFCITGDLAFFYDMNVLGIRHIGNNVRILLVNNGIGTEFKNYNHPAAKFGTDGDAFMAAAGHFGNKSKYLVKHYSEDLGFKYISASSKAEFENTYEQFITTDSVSQPILFEVFTSAEDESCALESIMHMEDSFGGKAKRLAKNILGDSGMNLIKNTLKK